MGSLTQPLAKTVYYYCDETCHLTEEFMAVGGIAVPDYRVQPICSELHRLKGSVKGEIKWGNTRGKGRDRVQIAYAEYLRELVKNGDVHLHFRFANFEFYQHELSGPAHRHDTCGKMFREILIHYALNFYGGRYKLRILPDRGPTTDRLEEFMPSMVARAMRQYPKVKRDCVEWTRQCNSQNHPLLQLLDVTLGAFGAVKNGRHLDGSLRPPKTNLAKLVHRLYGEPDLETDSEREVKNFSIWVGRPRKNWQAKLPVVSWHRVPKRSG